MLLYKLLTDKYPEIDITDMPYSRRAGNYLKGLQSAAKISIADNYLFDRSVDVLNDCFGKTYRAWMKAFCYLDEAKTIGVWFHKMAVIEYGIEQPQSKTKAWINTLSDDGTTIRMYSHTKQTIGRGTDTHITFAKFPGQPYKYIGTFVRDIEISRPDNHIFRRVAAEVNLSHWRTVNDNESI